MSEFKIEFKETKCRSSMMKIYNEEEKKCKQVCGTDNVVMAGAFPQFESIRPTMSRARRVTYPLLSKSLAELNIPDIWSKNEDL